jgi:hypothetical protein
LRTCALASHGAPHAAPLPLEGGRGRGGGDGGDPAKFCCGVAAPTCQSWSRILYITPASITPPPGPLPL